MALISSVNIPNYIAQNEIVYHVFNFFYNFIGHRSITAPDGVVRLHTLRKCLLSLFLYKYIKLEKHVCLSFQFVVKQANLEQKAMNLNIPVNVNFLTTTIQKTILE